LFASRPVRTLHRHLFQTGALLAVAAGFSLGAGPLTHIATLRAALALFIPAAAMLASDGMTNRKIAFPLFLLTGCGLFLLGRPSTADRPFFASRGAAADISRDPNSGRSRIRIGGREYVFPEDFQRRAPDALTSALQPRAERLRALVVEEAPSAAAQKIAALPWTESVRKLSYFPPASRGPHGPARFRRAMRQDPDARFDLVFVQEFPAASRSAQTMLFRTLLRRLAPGGVLVAPSECGAPVRGFRQTLLPGSQGTLRMWAADNVPTADTFPKLEAALKRRSVGRAELLPGGMLETLYDLRPPERAVAALPETPFRRIRTELAGVLPGASALLPAAAVLLLGFWLKRYPRRGENLAIFAKGAACMLGLLAIMEKAETFQLLISGPAAAFFGLVALGLPHRTEHPARAAAAAVIAAAIPAAVLSFSPENIPDPARAGFFPAAAVPTALCFGISLWCGTGHKGAESARCLHFAGMLFGAGLHMVLPAWAELATALALFPA